MKRLSEITSDEIGGAVNELTNFVVQLDGWGLVIDDLDTVREAIQETVLADPLPWITTKEADDEG